MRGKRDRQVWKVVDRMHYYWRADLEQIVRQGIADGVFRVDLKFDETLAFLMAVLSGSASADPEQMAAIQRQTDAWILSDNVKQKLARTSGVRKR